MTATTTRPCHHDNDDVVLVPFAKEHLKGALRLSQEISWPYRLEDWAIALELGHGFVLLDGAGSVIATAAWWAYGEDHAAAGMIIVAKAAQGRGHGARLMDALQAAAHPRTITLNSTAEGLALYEKRGFLRIGAIQQRQGVPDERHPAPPASLVRSMAASDVDAGARLDRQATGWARRQMLDRLFQASDCRVLVREGEPRGCAISRLFSRGHVIGPVVADSAADARASIEAALARLGQVFVRVDTPATSQLEDWLESIGLPQVGDATTIGPGPRDPAHRSGAHVRAGQPVVQPIRHEARARRRPAEAVLDVTDPEPLPEADPLSSHPRVRITPHIASMTQPHTAARVVIDNLRRHARGETLVGLVDRARGH